MALPIAPLEHLLELDALLGGVEQVDDGSLRDAPMDAPLVGAPVALLGLGERKKRTSRGTAITTTNLLGHLECDAVESLLKGAYILSCRRRHGVEACFF